MSDKPVRVVIVEDNMQICRFVAGAIRKSGCLAFETGTARAGLEAVAAEEADLVILDLGLPDMNGIDFIREVRLWSALPILVLSARSSEHDKIEALDAGADDYLTKPFGVGELLARVRVLLRRRNMADETVSSYRFADVEVDIAHHTVRRAGEDIHLTQIEHRLLAVLLVNTGKVLTHRHLMQEVWGPGHAEQEHYVRIYIRRLRQKIERDPTQPRHFLTETGIGYRFQP